MVIEGCYILLKGGIDDEKIQQMATIFKMQEVSLVNHYLSIPMPLDDFKKFVVCHINRSEIL